MKILEFILILVLLIILCAMAVFTRSYNPFGEEGMIGLVKPKAVADTGTAGPDICADLPVARMEFVVMLGRKLSFEQEYGPVGFTDIPEDSTGVRFIYPVIKAGLVAGYPDNTFRPNDLISKNEAEIIVARAFKRTAPPWYEKSPYLTRKQMYEMLSQVNSVGKW